MELFCGECQYAISAEEANGSIVRIEEDGENLEIDVECPKCGHINTIYTKAK